MKLKTIEEINQYKSKTVNPFKNHEEWYELYSVTNYEFGAPEILQGKDIASSKQVVEEGDILISKINPRINRVWIVGVFSEHIKIASSEWIVIRNSEISSKYLSYYFKTEKFRNLLSSQVTGIGGSLTRAQPKNVKVYKVPIFSKDYEEKVVNILEKTNELIKLRESQITALDELTQSLFLEMFGDPISNNRKWNISSFDEFALIDTKMTNDFVFHKEEYHVGIDNIEKNSGRLINLQKVSKSNLTSGKYIFNSEHIIYSKIRPYLNKVALPNFSGLCSADAYPLLPKKNKSTRYFLAYLLRSDAFLIHVSQNSDRTNIPKVNKKQLQSFQGILPPINLQIEFEEKVKLIEKKREMLIEALEKMDKLYNSLLQKAFKGELFQEP